MSVLKSYTTEDHANPDNEAHMAFIEDVIKSLRVLGHDDRVFFPFISPYRNNTAHSDPNITEKTRQIYFTIPGESSFTAPADFLEFIRRGDFEVTDKLPRCFEKAIRPKIHGYDRARPGEFVIPSAPVAFKGLSAEMKTFKDLPAEFINLAKKNELYVCEETYEHSGLIETGKTPPETDSVDQSLVSELSAFLKTIKDNDYELDDELPQCFYQALKPSMNYDIARPGDFVVKTTLYAYKALSYRMKTVKDLPPNFIELVHSGILEPCEAFDDHNGLVEAVADRVKTVCQYLPEHRPITLTIPVHFGSIEQHYHGFNVRIYDDYAEIVAVATLKGYADQEVCFGIIAGLSEGLGWSSADMSKYKVSQLYENQGDKTSCASTTTMVSLTVDPSKTLDEQKKAMTGAVASYRKNKAKAKSALADIYFASSGLTLSDTVLGKTLVGSAYIRKETEKYCSIYNKTRPFTFGIRYRYKEDDKIYTVVYAVRVTEDHCEMISMYDTLDKHKSRNKLARKALKDAIKKALGVEDEFFTEPKKFTYDPSVLDSSPAAKTASVAVNIDPNKTLAEQRHEIRALSVGAHSTLPTEAKAEIVFSFRCHPLKEKIIEKQDELEKALSVALGKKTSSKKSSSSSGEGDYQSSGSSESIKESEAEVERKRLEQLKFAEEEEKRKEAERIRLEQLKLVEEERRLKEIEREKRRIELIDEMHEQTKKEYRSFERNESYLPEYRLFWKAQEAVLKERKYKDLEEADKFQALQFAAVDVLQDAYSKQTDKYKHDLDLCIKLTIGLGILLISLPIIWIAFWLLHHSDDIKKVAVDRQTFNGFQKAWYGADAKSAEALIEHPEHKPTEADHGNEVFGQNAIGQVHAYFWNSKDYQRFIADLDEYKATLQAVEAT